MLQLHFKKQFTLKGTCMQYAKKKKKDYAYNYVCTDITAELMQLVQVESINQQKINLQQIW